MTSHVPNKLTGDSPDSTSAFTLIELLTVIAIIGILAAIIIPTVGKVRESGRAAHCTSNMRQISTALLLYASENKQQIMPVRNPTIGTYGVGSWCWELWAHMGYPPDARTRQNVFTSREGSTNKNVFICPTTFVTKLSTPMFTSNASKTPNPNLISYGLNPVKNGDAASGGIGTAALSTPLSLSSVTTPSRTVILVESSFYYGDDYNYRSEFGLLPHSGKANFAYFDGHVQRLAKPDCPDQGTRAGKIFWYGQ
ncbi:prepilin-type N-terminal cleavage/methylation domain-containing protein [Opitutaceae bacterium TAV1]|nr:prepilin-type N-terminal cleavage/methylation domain-containing protein [Opitutaceae bacterium TAV1]